MYTKMIFVVLVILSKPFTFILKYELIKGSLVIIATANDKTVFITVVNCYV